MAQNTLSVSSAAPRFEGGAAWPNLAVERTSASSSASILARVARLAEAAHLETLGFLQTMSKIKIQVICFAALSSIHLLLFASWMHLPDPVGGYVLLVSLFPWFPLLWIGLPVTVPAYVFGFIPFPAPNFAGWLWCASVWLAVYWFASRVVARRFTRPAR